eukprot:UN34376
MKIHYESEKQLKENLEEKSNLLDETITGLKREITDLKNNNSKDIEFKLLCKGCQTKLRRKNPNNQEEPAQSRPSFSGRSRLSVTTNGSSRNVNNINKNTPPRPPP